MGGGDLKLFLYHHHEPETWDFHFQRLSSFSKLKAAKVWKHNCLFLIRACETQDNVIPTVLLWAECLGHPKVYMLKSNPHVIFNDGTFGRYLGYEGGTLMIELVTL